MQSLTRSVHAFTRTPFGQTLVALGCGAAILALIAFVGFSIVVRPS